MFATRASSATNIARSCLGLPTHVSRITNPLHLPVHHRALTDDKREPMYPKTCGAMTLFRTIGRCFSRARPQEPMPPPPTPNYPVSSGMEGEAKNILVRTRPDRFSVNNVNLPVRPPFITRSTRIVPPRPGRREGSKPMVPHISR